MNIKESWYAILGTVGGTGVIVIGLSAWLGNIMASQIEASTTAMYQSEIKVLESELELSRTQLVRNSEAQFRLYSETWIDLVELQSAADRLWASPSRVNLESFIALLKNARLGANRGRLILEEEHYQKLQDTFKALSKYEAGKGRLIKLRSPGDVEELYREVGEQSIVDQIHRNAESKQKYEALMIEILTGFRKQLGLSTLTSP